MASRFLVGWRRSVWLRLALAMGLIAAAGPLTGLARGRKPSPSIGDIESVVVRRDDLDTTLLAGGDFRSTRDVIVACQVEDITDSDGTMILSIIPNGTAVKKGDELCRLDSSPFEELARQQEIAVNQARALELQARLLLETARLALREYQEGLVTQTTQEFEGRIALGRSDVQRQADRLVWTEGMVAKGYLSRGQLITERQNLARARHELRKTEGAFRLFRRFEVPKEIRTLQAEIETAATNHGVEAGRLESREDRLAHLRKQIAHCILRAPRDGVVVHANNNRWWARPLQEGDRVYEEQEMFLLPDLTQMEVHVSVHESMGARVRVGMKAGIRIASMGDRVFAGRVTAIDLLPSPDWKQWDESVKRFLARVRLDQTPRSVLPFMSAIVEIDTGRVPDALVIPVEAMALVDGRQSCYVVGLHGLERRAITTRRATTDLLEVTGGLAEGERVVVRSFDVAGIPGEDTNRAPARDFARARTASPSRPEPPDRSTARAS